MDKIIGLVGVLMALFGFVVFGKAPTAVQENLAINLLGYGFMLLGLSEIIRQLKIIAKGLRKSE